MSDYQGLNPNPSVGSAGALTGNPQFQKEWEAKQNLEYLDKVAIEAMKVYLSNQHVAHVETMGGNEWVAKNSYQIAQAMLAEKKRIEAADKENVK